MDASAYDANVAKRSVENALLDFPWNKFDSYPKEAKKQMIQQFASQIGWCIPYVKIPSGSVLLRCRCNGYFDSETEITYPPLEKTPLGRMNLEKDPEFYSSLVDVTNDEKDFRHSFMRAHELTVMETSELFHNINELHHVKQKVTIGIWQTLSDIKVLCPIGEDDFTDRSNIPVLSFVKHRIQESGADRKELLRLISNCISPYLQCDTNDSNPDKYIFSATFANYMLKYSRFHREGIIYPSMQGKNTENCNVVLRPDIVDNKLDLAYILHAVFYVADHKHAVIDPQVLIDMKTGTKYPCLDSNINIAQQLDVSEKALENFCWWNN